MSVGLFPELDEGQRFMLDTVTKVIESACPMTTVRDLAEKAAPSDPDLRRRLAEAGCFGLLSTEELGGGSISGNGVVDAAIVASERGARLQPGPFVGTSVVVDSLSSVSPNALQLEVLSSLIDGRIAAGWALVQPDALTVQEGDDGALVLSGNLPAVQDADECASLLLTVVGKDLQLLVSLDADGVQLENRERLDVTRRFVDVRLDGVTIAADSVLTPSDPAGLLKRQQSLAAVLAAAESVGAMDSDFKLAVEYAKIRTAFGRPIGSFQAVKHRLADTALMIEMAKGIVASAAEAVGRRASDSDVLASVAKAFVGDRSIEAAHNCFQVFGGIGFTWEHDQHLYLRRLASDAYLSGSPRWHRDRLWDQLDTTNRSLHV